MKKLPYVLTKLKILIAIPTYGRAGDVTSHEMFTDPVLVVHTSQLADYQKAYPNVQILEYTKPEGNIPRKKNFVLDWATEQKYDVVFFIDDDYHRFNGNGSGIPTTFDDPVDIYHAIETHAQLAIDAGTALFTFHNIPDIRRYAKNKPFELFTTFKRGNFGVILSTVNKKFALRFDERFILNEDIDLGLQALHDYRMILSDSRYAFQLKNKMGAKGGLAAVRHSDREKEYHDLLQRKWGALIDDGGRSWAKRLTNYTVKVLNPFS